MSLNYILLFSMTVFVASIVPGPSMLLALTHGMHFGVKRTMASAMGNVTVTIVQASISIAGLGAVLMASETMFRAIKWAGAIYLIYMGVDFLRSSKTSFSPTELSNSEDLKSLRKMYAQGALVTAGNPKAIVFFTSIFPQFVDPNTTHLIQFSFLLSICAFIAFTCFMIYAIAGSKIVTVFSNTSFGKYIRRIIGGTFVGAGIGLAISNK